MLQSACGQEPQASPELDSSRQEICDERHISFESFLDRHNSTL
jgi:hypothetical protein